MDFDPFFEKDVRFSIFSVVASGQNLSTILGANLQLIIT